MRTFFIGLLVGLAACSSASAGQLASERAETKAAATISLTSSAFAEGQPIPLRFSAYGDGVSPPLQWDEPPAGTASFVLMVEDPDATSHKPYVHWLAWNIPPATRQLPEAVTAADATMVQGRNHHGDNAWFGPRPGGSSPHHYYFQLFALDSTLALPKTASRDDLLGAMKGHVLAAGKLLGTFARPNGD